MSKKEGCLAGAAAVAVLFFLELESEPRETLVLSWYFWWISLFTAWRLDAIPS
jgi:hypothetical protein